MGNLKLNSCWSLPHIWGWLPFGARRYGLVVSTSNDSTNIDASIVNSWETSDSRICYQPVIVTVVVWCGDCFVYFEVATKWLVTNFRCGVTNLRQQCWSIFCKLWSSVLTITLMGCHLLNCLVLASFYPATWQPHLRQPPAPPHHYTILWRNSLSLSLVRLSKSLRLCYLK